MIKADISVIITSFGCEEHIKQCVKSVVDQTLPVSEIIIIDDSTANFDIDLFMFILNEYESMPIYIISTLVNTGGPSYPRNLGIDIASSTYVAFLDGDDYWYADKIELQYPMLQFADAVCSNYDILKNEAIYEFSTLKKIHYKSMLTRCHIGSPTGIVKRNISPRFLNIPNEDYKFWIDVSKFSYILSFTSKSLACYRVQKNSRSSNTIKNIRGIFNILKNESPTYCYIYFIIYVLNNIIKLIRGILSAEKYNAKIH